jgi:hypothetical protein
MLYKLYVENIERISMKINTEPLTRDIINYDTFFSRDVLMYTTRLYNFPFYSIMLFHYNPRYVQLKELRKRVMGVKQDICNNKINNAKAHSENAAPTKSCHTGLPQRYSVGMEPNEN